MVTGMITGQLSVRPSKIVAGHEPEKTNEFLQAMGTAILHKVGQVCLFVKLRKLLTVEICLESSPYFQLINLVDKLDCCTQTSNSQRFPLDIIIFKKYVGCSWFSEFTERLSLHLFS